MGNGIGTECWMGPHQPAKRSKLSVIWLSQASRPIVVVNTDVCMISFSADSSTQLETLEIWENHCLKEIESLPRSLQSIYLGNCEMLKSLTSFAGMTSLRKLSVYGCRQIEKMEGIPRTLESITLRNCEMLQSIPSFAQSTSLRKFVLYGCCKIEKIEGIENCTELTELSADTCWEVPGLESLERMQNLKRLKLHADKGAVIKRCIQRTQKWPDEIDIFAQAIPNVASVVDSLRSWNVVIVDSISDQKIKSGPKLVKVSSSGEAFMVCLVINCRSSQMTVQIGSQPNRRGMMSPRPSYVRRLCIGDQVRRAWVGVFTQASYHDFSTSEHVYIYETGECGEEDVVEKGLVVRGEEQTLFEALRSLLPLYQT